MRGSTLITIRLPAASREQIETAAARNQLSASEIVRRAIDDYLGADGGRSVDVRRAREILRTGSRAS